MARLSKVNPFKHDTRNDKKRKSRHADRYVEERRTLDALMQGNYSAPIVDHQPPQAELDNNYSDGYEAHQELNSGDESTAQVDTNTVLSGWSSIPWNVTSTSNGIQSSNLVPHSGPSFIAAARARDRDINGQILANNRNKACRNCLPPTCGSERKPTTGLPNRPSRILLLVLQMCSDCSAEGCLD
ncbi:hypothetical protein PSHT_16388 [Puccinia striiformis]|uniref:Uncharacterized protein n=1 Tax=Puccinia striiformis TaxID=27350 RepID=A0A2S4UA79_9BASI|nr:hypothetical protein PSHT_16388 [Puccinia striiformis]